MNYSEKTMKEIRSNANFWMRCGNYKVSVYDDEKGVSINNPWFDETGRFEFETDEEAIRYHGKTLFEEFCKRAVAYLYISKTDKTGIIRLSDIPFYGDFVLIDIEANDAIIHDSRVDGYDINPLLSNAPVVSMEVKESIFYITIMETLYLKGE